MFFFRFNLLSIYKHMCLTRDVFALTDDFIELHVFDISLWMPTPSVWSRGESKCSLQII